MAKKFREYKHLDLVQVSKETLEEWKQNNVFEKSISTRDGNPSFVFYEGPPSANGKPGIHHVLARSIKDIFCRYQTLKGKQVFRKAGWDTHGLPVELGTEKELGITKEDIGTKISIEEYNNWKLLLEFILLKKKDLSKSKPSESALALDKIEGIQASLDEKDK